MVDDRSPVTGKLSDNSTRERESAYLVPQQIEISVRIVRKSRPRRSPTLIKLVEPYVYSSNISINTDHIYVKVFTLYDDVKICIGGMEVANGSMIEKTVTESSAGAVGQGGHATIIPRATVQDHICSYERVREMEY